MKKTVMNICMCLALRKLKRGRDLLARKWFYELDSNFGALEFSVISEIITERFERCIFSKFGNFCIQVIPRLLGNFSIFWVTHILVIGIL